MILNAFGCHVGDAFGCHFGCFWVTCWMLLGAMLDAFGSNFGCFCVPFWMLLRAILDALGCNFCCFWMPFLDAYGCHCSLAAIFGRDQLGSATQCRAQALSPTSSVGAMIGTMRPMLIFWDCILRSPQRRRKDQSDSNLAPSEVPNRHPTPAL